MKNTLTVLFKSVEELPKRYKGSEKWFIKWAFPTMDAGRQLTRRLAATQNVTVPEQVFVSPENNGSLVAERFIRTISNLVVSSLSGNSQQWDLYSNACTYALNTFGMTSMDRLSAYQLVYHLL